MVRLRVTVLVPPPPDPRAGAEAITNFCDDVKGPAFLHIVPHPEQLTMIELANRIRAKWLELHPHAAALRIRMLVDNDHPNITVDPLMTVADVFVDQGKANTEGYDQRATLRVVQHSIPDPITNVTRSQSILQDWDSHPMSTTSKATGQNILLLQPNQPVGHDKCVSPSIETGKIEVVVPYSSRSDQKPWPAKATARRPERLSASDKYVIEMSRNRSPVGPKRTRRQTERYSLALKPDTDMDVVGPKTPIKKKIQHKGPDDIVASPNQRKRRRSDSNTQSQPKVENKGRDEPREASIELDSNVQAAEALSPSSPETEKQKSSKHSRHVPQTDVDTENQLSLAQTTLISHDTKPTGVLKRKVVSPVSIPEAENEGPIRKKAKKAVPVKPSNTPSNKSPTLKRGGPFVPKEQTVSPEDTTWRAPPDNCKHDSSNDTQNLVENDSIGSSLDDLNEVRTLEHDFELAHQKGRPQGELAQKEAIPQITKQVCHIEQQASSPETRKTGSLLEDEGKKPDKIVSEQEEQSSSPPASPSSSPENSSSDDASSSQELGSNSVEENQSTGGQTEGSVIDSDDDESNSSFISSPSTRSMKKEPIEDENQKLSDADLSRKSPFQGNDFGSTDSDTSCSDFSIKEPKITSPPSDDFVGKGKPFTMFQSTQEKLSSGLGSGLGTKRPSNPRASVSALKKEESDGSIQDSTSMKKKKSGVSRAASSPILRAAPRYSSPISFTQQPRRKTLKSLKDEVMPSDETSNSTNPGTITNILKQGWATYGPSLLSRKKGE